MRSANIRSYRDLEVWQKAMDMVIDCYRTAQQFPKKEVHGLSSQIERAAVSVAANIAEGRSRDHTKEFLNHLSIACGSLAELETDLQIANRLGYIDSDTLDKLLERTEIIGRMIHALRRSLRRNV